MQLNPDWKKLLWRLEMQDRALLCLLCSTFFAIYVIDQVALVPLDSCLEAINILQKNVCTFLTKVWLAQKIVNVPSLRIMERLKWFQWSSAIDLWLRKPWFYFGLPAIFSALWKYIIIYRVFVEKTWNKLKSCRKGPT